MMNSMKIPSKRSSLEKKLDKLILTLFSVLFGMCLLGAIGSGIYINKKYFYLRFESSSEAQSNPDNRFVVADLTMFTLITLYSLIIPISLYVSIEVEYIFSDKTGTLTRNLMEFFKCSIGGEIYVSGITEIEMGTAQRSGTRVEVMKIADAGADIVRITVQGKKEADACFEIKNTLVQKP